MFAVQITECIFFEGKPFFSIMNDFLENFRSEKFHCKFGAGATGGAKWTNLGGEVVIAISTILAHFVDMIN